MKLIGLLVFCMLLLGVALCGAAWFGSQHPLPIWYSLVMCAQPCWAGIQPGSTNVGEARDRYLNQHQLLESPRFYRTRPDVPFRWVVNRVPTQDDGVIVPVLYIQPVTPITVGELIARFGQPDRIQAVVTLNGAECTVQPQKRCVVFTLVFDRLGLDVATDPLPGATISPTATIYQMTFSNDPDYLAYGTEPWRGFGTARAYRLLVP